MKNLPLGFIIASQKKLEYVNDECKKIFEEEKSESESKEELDQKKLAEIINCETQLTLEELIKNQEKLETVKDKQFTYKKSPSKTFTFTLKFSIVPYNLKDSLAIILQDQTVYEQLKQEQEKHQRVYLASVVHDIRTPLNGILGMMEMIEEVNENSAVANYIKAARGSAKLLLFLTYDITDFSQIEAGIISINMMPLEPEVVIDEIIQLLEFNFQRKGVQLIKSINSGMPMRIQSDRNRYMQILLNLIGNAMKFTFKGCVKIKLEYFEGSDMLFTSVEDTGIGIKEEDLPNLFRLFGKIKENANLNPTGVGMGLVICKRLTELLGGSINVSSVYKSGTIFTFSVKCNLARSNASNNSEREIIPGLAGHRDFKMEPSAIKSTKLLAPLSPSDIALPLVSIDLTH